MSRKSSLIGALHPVLFFIFVYGISLLLALFICRVVYYSLNKDKTEQEQYVVRNHSATF